MDHSSWPKHVHPKSQEIHPEDVPLGGSSHLVSGLVHPSDLHGISRVNPHQSLGWTNPLTSRGMSHQALVFAWNSSQGRILCVHKPVPSAHQHSSTEPQHLGRVRGRESVDAQNPCLAVGWNCLKLGVCHDFWKFPIEKCCKTPSAHTSASFFSCASRHPV